MPICIEEVFTGNESKVVIRAAMWPTLESLHAYPNGEGIEMKKGKQTAGKRTIGMATARHVAEEAKPTTYELLLVDLDGEPGTISMTGREVFENNCPGESPEQYEGIDEADVLARMLSQADRLAIIEDRWHPDDVPLIAQACTDFIIDIRESRKLDSMPPAGMKIPARPGSRKK
jgi:hypothetical protein